MAIKFDNTTKSFFLETKNTMYQMKVDPIGVLKHIWYGEKTFCDMEYLLNYGDVGFSGNPYDVQDDRTYSLDTIPLEYSCGGIGDFRISAIDIQHKNGSNALDLRYASHSIVKGKYSINGLPAVYDNDNSMETLEIVLKDTSSKVQVTLKYAILESLDIITRCATITNNGNSAIKITKADSICLDVPKNSWELVHFYGKHAMERQVERVPLIRGIQEISSKRGTSSHQHNPAVILCQKDCTETNGNCIGALLVYSGSFKTQIEVDQLEQTRLVMGINDDRFSWNLEENQTFYTPEVILSYSSNGFERLSHNFHNVIRNNICRGKYKLSERPVLINNWEATYFNFNEEKIFNIVKQASELGVDMFVLDDGWFGKRDDDNSGLGDWFVNDKKLKGGLKPLVEKITSLGMKFGIWFEPEMISEDSDLYRNHSDWVIKIPNRLPTKSRNQLVLDMSREDVRNYLYNCISNILDSAEISYIKWDMNRSICDLYSNSLSAENQGELSYRYVLGLYELLERLTSNYPNVLFEGCSGGGGRFDAGILYYCPQIWCSDNTDAYSRTKIQYGTSFFYPISTMGSHVSCTPNHQTGRITPLETRGITAMAGSFGYELDLNTLSEDEKLSVKQQIIKFKQYRSLIHNGNYYRLTNPMSENLAIWSFVNEDKSKVLVQGMIYQSRSNCVGYTVKLTGLDLDKKYRLNGTERIFTGKALTYGGIQLPIENGDYFPIELYFIEE